MSIEVKNLTHIYDPGLPSESVALSDISFDIDDGEMVGIIGHTGSGKSTLLQHLNGLLKPTEGKIIIDGTDITEPGIPMVDIRRKVGLVFQYPEYQLFEETVAKDVAFGPRNLGLGEDETDERVREAIGLVGLNYDEIHDRSPFELSGGQKRRAAIAGVIAMRPDVLILDEPTAGLDPKAHKDILKMIDEVHSRTGNITILASHNMADIAEMSDRIIVINEGRLVLTGSPYEVFSQREKLEEVGLALPPVTQFTEKLREDGVPLAETILSVDDAVDQIFAFLNHQPDADADLQDIREEEPND